MPVTLAAGNSKAQDAAPQEAQVEETADAGDAADAVEAMAA
jgi:hypothetical protein